MRWYKIQVGSGFTLDATGDPNALQVEMDIVISQGHNPGSSSCKVSVFGIPLQTLLNARQFIGQSIKVYGGMQKGLPLANPNQQGLLVQGQVLPALGNWVGVDQTIDFYIKSGTGLDNPAGAANVVHNWPANTPLAQAVKQTLQVAYPKLTPIINISPKLKLNYTDTGFYQSFQQYAQYIFQISRSIMGGKYTGVKMYITGNKIKVQDDTYQSPAKTVNYWDLVGQPIWTGISTAQITTVMRGDFDVGDSITLPKTLATLGSNLNGSSVNIPNNTIQGSFFIRSIRHVGNFREPSWSSWITVFGVADTSADIGGGGGGGTSTGRIRGPV